MIFAASPTGICYLSLGDDDESLEAAMRETVLAEEYKHAGGAALAVGPYLGQVTRYLQGESTRLDLPHDARGTEFQESVWAIVSKVPFGQTISYTEVAEALGSPNSVRSVSQACSANPVPMIIPCHRVVQRDGRIGGYVLGPEMKRFLLHLEEQAEQRLAN